MLEDRRRLQAKLDETECTFQPLTNQKHPHVKSKVAQGKIHFAVVGKGSPRSKG